MHILFISSWYPSKTHPTLGNFVRRHAQAVATQHDVTVIHANHANGLKLPDDESNFIGGVHEHITYFNKGILMSKSRRIIAYKKLFLNWLDAGNPLPDVVHLNVLHPAGKIALWLKENFKIPFVVTEHWTGYHPERNANLRPFQKSDSIKVASMASVICPVSNHLGKAMKNWGINGEYSVVPNVVDTELFDMGIEPKQPTILHVSHLGDDHKNVTGIINTFSDLLKTHPNTRLQVIGDGDTTPYLHLAKELQIPKENIQIEGEKSLEEIAELMKQCTIFTLFSRYENLPCVIIEAFSSGKPVVSSDVGGISEILDDNRGVLVNSEDQAALLKAWQKALSQAWDRPAIRAYASNHFSKEAIASQFTEVYMRAIKDVH